MTMLRLRSRILEVSALSGVVAFALAGCGDEEASNPSSTAGAGGSEPVAGAGGTSTGGAAPTGGQSTGGSGGSPSTGGLGSGGDGGAGGLPDGGGGAGGVATGGSGGAPGTGGNAAGAGGSSGGAPGLGDVDLTLGGFNQDLPAPNMDCVTEPAPSVGCLSFTGEWNGRTVDATCIESIGPAYAGTAGSAHFVGCRAVVPPSNDELLIYVRLSDAFIGEPPSAFVFELPPDTDADARIDLTDETGGYTTHVNQVFALSDTHTHTAKAAGITEYVPGHRRARRPRRFEAPSPSPSSPRRAALRRRGSRAERFDCAETSTGARSWTRSKYSDPEEGVQPRVRRPAGEA